MYAQPVRDKRYVGCWRLDERAQPRASKLDADGVCRGHIDASNVHEHGEGDG